MIKTFKFSKLNVIATLFLLYGLGLFIFGGYTVGNLMVFVLGIIFFFFDLCGKTIPNTNIVKLIKFLLSVGMGIIFAIIMFLVFKVGVPPSDNNEDAVIVLGCGLRGTEISRTLKERLNSCIEYYNENPNAIIVVSGGQGLFEEIPEAVAMENYLLENNIPKDKIIKEDKSSSTYENFEFSKKILDELFKDKEDYKVAFITNRFHCYRAYNLAKNVGIEANCYSSSDEWSTAIPSYLRESLAAIKLWIFGV